MCSMARSFSAFSIRCSPATPLPESFAPFLTTLDLKKRTQELRLASPSGGSVERMIGAYYTKEESDYLPEVFALRYESAERIELAKTHFRAYALGWNVSDYRGQQIVSPTSAMTIRICRSWQSDIFLGRTARE